MLPETLGQVILGGGMIGLALALLMILTGRVMAASGMVGSLLGGHEGLAATSIAFIAGLFIAPSVLIALGSSKQPLAEAGWLLLAGGGLLVGVGARLGNSSVLGAIGGLARLSGRSVWTFLAIVAGVASSSIVLWFLGSGGVA